jgi:hypothetical protein
MYNITINNNKYEVIPENGATFNGTVNGDQYALEMA